MICIANMSSSLTWQALRNDIHIHIVRKQAQAIKSLPSFEINIKTEVKSDVSKKTANGNQGKNITYPPRVTCDLSTQSGRKCG
jgi:hypothetical protein